MRIFIVCTFFRAQHVHYREASLIRNHPKSCTTHLQKQDHSNCADPLPNSSHCIAQMLFDFQYLLLLICGLHKNKLILLIHLATFVPLLWVIFGTLRTISSLFPYALAVSYGIYCTLLEPIAGMLFSLVLFALAHYSQAAAGLGIRRLIVALCLLLLVQFIPMCLLKNRARTCKIIFVFFSFEAFYFWMQFLFVIGYRPVLREKICSRASSE